MPSVPLDIYIYIFKNYSLLQESSNTFMPTLSDLGRWYFDGSFSPSINSMFGFKVLTILCGQFGISGDFERGWSKNTEGPLPTGLPCLNIQGMSIL